MHRCILPPRRPWAWADHLGLIAFGMSSACCLPMCVSFLIYWFKPETRKFFGRA